MFASTIVAFALPLLAAAAPMKKSSGARATYYDTSVGLGACGELHQNSEYTVAMNSAQFGSGYPSDQCGKSIWITYGGKTVTAVIKDECPSCPYNGLDLSEGLFSALADKSLGVLSVDWGYGSGSSDNTATTTTKEAEPTSTYVAPTSTSVAPVEAAVETTSTSAAAAAAETSSAAETIECPANRFILYNGDVSLYDQQYFKRQDLTLLYDWAVKSELVSLLANTTSYCLNGTSSTYNSTESGAASSLLEFFDF